MSPLESGDGTTQQVATEAEKVWEEAQRKRLGAQA